MSEQEEPLTDSRLAMWRGVVVMIHADDIVTPQELSFINDYIKDMNLSKEQQSIIADDLENPKNSHDIFKEITDEKDKKDFFALARAVAWCDGCFVEQEKRIIKLFQEENFCDDSLKHLKNSRDVMNEVELNKDQWLFKTEKSKKLFGFLNKNNS